MNVFLIYAYLFFCGSAIGYVIELLFRRFISPANPERKWINPGFCVGPYIPLYGFGLCILYALSAMEELLSIENIVLSKMLVILLMMICLTVIEYLAGFICLKYFHVRLWDYSDMKFNIQGLICPLFTLIWGGCSALYLFFVHPYILDSLIWLSENLAFSFFIGFFYGVFVIDVAYSSNLITKIKKYAKDNDVIVKWERMKSEIRSKADKLGEKASFIFPMKLHKLITGAIEKVKSDIEELVDKREDAKAEKNTKNGTSESTDAESTGEPIVLSVPQPPSQSDDDSARK